jgi:SpoVK/Ycf46/Vps4 family AAA+-type ATPase
MQIHTSRMTMSDDVNLEEFVMTKDEFSGADIKAICTEAGLLALRERRMKVRMLVVTDIMSISFICAGLVCLCPNILPLPTFILSNYDWLCQIYQLWFQFFLSSYLSTRIDA